MRFFVETVDKRCEYLLTLLNSNSRQAFVLDYDSMKSGETAIFSPAKKFDALELELLPRGATVFGGAISDEFSEILREKQIVYFNFMKNGAFAIKNSNLTAEAVLSIIIAQTVKSIYELKILVLGGGRLAKSVGTLFRQLNLDTAFATYRPSEKENLLYFADKIYAGDAYFQDLGTYDVIINTIPAPLFDEQSLQKIEKDTLLIETASVPCLDAALAGHFRYLPSPALPQKYSPYAAAKIMMETILGEING